MLICSPFPHYIGKKSVHVLICSDFPHYIGKKGVRVLIEAALLGGSVIARFTFERNCYNVLELSCVPVPLPKMSKGLFMLCHECPKDYHVTCLFRLPSLLNPHCRIHI